MYWYDKYKNITETGNFILDKKENILYNEYLKVVINSKKVLNSFYYIKINNEFKRVYSRDIGRKFSFLNLRDAKEKFPQYFI